jgi:hypothetical protein
MARKNMPTATSAINTADGSTSYVSIARRRIDFPTHLDVRPAVADLNNPMLSFTATLKSFTPKRAVVQLTAVNPPGGAVTPADGILSITLFETTGGGDLPVTETPVDYIND